MSIINIAAYKFVTLDDYQQLRQPFLDKCLQLQLKGSILLSLEGINLFLAGTRNAIDEFNCFLAEDERFHNMEYKESISAEQPFNRMLVKLKKEIISMGEASIQPEQYTSTHLSAKELKQWYDEGKDFVILDTRNEYEARLGTFDNALTLPIDTFRAFPEACQHLPDEVKGKPVVTFCTGGIRCEKAAPFLEKHGFKDVYQLDGGILRYFEECGGEHYHGDCFVFDQRVAVDSQLQETDIAQCYACLSPLTESEQHSDDYVIGESCPHCINGKPTKRLYNQPQLNDGSHHAAIDA